MGQPSYVLMCCSLYYCTVEIKVLFLHLKHIFGALRIIRYFWYPPSSQAREGQIIESLLYFNKILKLEKNCIKFRRSEK